MVPSVKFTVRRPIAILCLTLILATMSFTRPQANQPTPQPEAAEPRLSGTKYYVSASTGRDSWPGTELQPWKTLEKVSSRSFQPNDQIFFKRGDSWISQRLTLQGSGDYRNGWIRAGAYGVGAKPHIMNPPYHPDRSLVDWKEINEAYPGTERYQIKVAVEIKGDNWMVSDLEISHAEAGLLIRGNMGYLLENLYIHHIGYRDNGEPLLEHEGGHLLFPKYPRSEEITRETGVVPMWTNPVPMWGNAIEVSGEKVTIQNVVIEKATGGIQGYVAEGRIDNIYLDKVSSGGLGAGGNDVKISHATVLNSGWPGKRFAWWGICAAGGPGGDSSMEITDSEIAYVGWVDPLLDACGPELELNTSGVLWARNFIHHNAGPAFEFLGGGGPNQHIVVEENVTYANGYLSAPEYQGPGPEFFIDACPWGTQRVTIRRNQIYKAIPGQYANYFLSFYDPEKPSKSFSNDWSFAQENAQYTVHDNHIHEAGTYKLPLPIPVPLPDKENVALQAILSVSSGTETAALAKDNNFETEWKSNEKKPWIALAWDTPQTVDEIWLTDRRDLENWGVSGLLVLSDGWHMDVIGGIFNNGAVRKIPLDKPRTVKWVRYQVTRNVPESPGTQVGLGELLVFKSKTKTPPVDRHAWSLKSNIDFEDRPHPPTLLRGEDYGIDWKNADWTTRKDPRTGNHYLYVDFPSYEGIPPPWAIRPIALPWDTTIKSIKIACPEGAVGYISQVGQETVFFSCTSELTEHETGWTVANAKSNLIQIYINVNDAVKKNGVSAGLNDVWFDDIVVGFPLNSS